MDDKGGAAGRQPHLVPPKTTAEDIRQFRANMDLVRIARRGHVAEFAAKVLAGALAVHHAAGGVRRYGWSVRKRDGVPMARQFYMLMTDYFYCIRPDDFYPHQLYLEANRDKRQRHFPFSEVCAMQEYLIDRARCVDYPLLRSKSLFAAACAERGLPTVPILAEFAAGQVTPDQPALPDADLFSKPSDRMLGLGLSLWQRAAPGMYRNPADNQPLNAQSLLARLRDQSSKTSAHGGSGNIVLQRKVSNHGALLGLLTTNGLATVRVVTCRTGPATFGLLPPVIRMPVGNAIADNIAPDGLAAPIDSLSGQICGPAVRKDREFGLSSFERHPTTGAVLTGIEIPFWSDVLGIARRAHQAFPSMHFVGWDIAVLPQGPVLLEGNAWWDVDLTVLPHRITLSDTPFVALYNQHLAAALAATA